MPASPTVDVVYATDEDIFVEAGADYGVLVPKSNLVAAGVDGVFAAGSPWALASASNDFAGQGLAPGMVMALSGPPAAFKNGPQYLAVDSVAGHTATLRRCGMASGVGLPPGGLSGAALTGVTFAVATLAPQVEDTAYKLDQLYDADPAVPFHSGSSIYDPRVFRRLTALRVVANLYLSENRGDKGDFAEKAKTFQAAYEAELETAVVRWGPRGNSSPPTSRFDLKITR